MSILPGLRSLESLYLAGQFAISEAATATHRIPLPILDFSFRGTIADLDRFFGAFDLPAVKRWRFRVDVQKIGVPKDSRLRDIIRRCGHMTRRVVLRWCTKSKCIVNWFDEVNPGKFDLSLVVHDAAPCEAMAQVLLDVGELISVHVLALHGGPEPLDVGEPDDNVIGRVIDALPNVRVVTVSGNGNSWVRFPVVLVGRMRNVGNVWRGLDVVEFRKGKCLGYVMADWVKFFVEKDGISKVVIDEWTLQASNKQEMAALSLDLFVRVKEVKGTWTKEKAEPLYG